MFARICDFYRRQSRGVIESRPYREKRAETIWLAYTRRWPVEPGIRFRKQRLGWTTPRFHRKETGDRWSWGETDRSFFVLDRFSTLRYT